MRVHMFLFWSPPRACEMQTDTRALMPGTRNHNRLIPIDVYHRTDADHWFTNVGKLTSSQMQCQNMSESRRSEECSYKEGR